MRTLRIEVRPAEKGRTLQALLHDRGGFSHAEARGLIDAGAVRGPRVLRPGDYAVRVAPGERYDIRHDPDRKYRPRPVTRRGRGFRVIHEDRDVLVIDKGPELLSVPTELRREESLVDRLLEAEHRRGVRHPTLYAVHRLDRETSGLMMLARTRRACAGLKSQFEERTVARRYVAVAEGVVRPVRGRFESRLVEDPRSRRMRSARRRETGKEAITEYEVTEQLPGATVLAIRLRTGRKNQIRAHLAEAEHPLFGDRRYGRPSHLIRRVALHASSLAFIHPVSGRRMSFTSALPPDLRALIRRLRAHAKRD